VLLDKLSTIIEKEYSSALSEIKNSFQKWTQLKQIENESENWARSLSKEMVELKKKNELPGFDLFWENKIT